MLAHRVLSLDLSGGGQLSMVCAFVRACICFFASLSKGLQRMWPCSRGGQAGDGGLWKWPAMCGGQRQLQTLFCVVLLVDK